MDFDSDRLLLARAQLSDLLEILRLTHFDSNPVMFLMRLDAIRHNAAEHRFTGVAEIVSHYEEALRRVECQRGTETIIRYYDEILEEAIGCSHLGPEIAQSLLASVAMRLQG